MTPLFLLCLQTALPRTAVGSSRTAMYVTGLFLILEPVLASDATHAQSKVCVERVNHQGERFDASAFMGILPS